MFLKVSFPRESVAGRAITALILHYNSAPKIPRCVPRIDPMLIVSEVTAGRRAQEKLQLSDPKGQWTLIAVYSLRLEIEVNALVD